MPHSEPNRTAELGFTPFVDHVIAVTEKSMNAHPEWETREQMTARLAGVKAQLIAMQATLIDQRINMKTAIEYHIDNCYREIRRIKAGDQVATAELVSESLAERAKELNQSLDQVSFLERQIEDIQGDLDDDDIWKD